MGKPTDPKEASLDEVMAMLAPVLPSQLHRVVRSALETAYNYGGIHALETAIDGAAQNEEVSRG